MHRLVSVRALAPYEVWLRFEERRERVVDLGDPFALGDVFATIAAQGEFAKVWVDREFGAIEWPGEVDLDPDALCKRLERGATSRG